MKRIIQRCSVLFTQTNGVIHVRTASCQNGAIKALRHVTKPVEVVCSPCAIPNSSVKLEENTIFLNRREISFINKEVHRLLKAKIAEDKRKKKAGIPAPPTPGKIIYGVYQ